MKDLSLNYNYVYFNTNYLPKGQIDSNEYNSICLRDAENLKDVLVVPRPAYFLPQFLRLACTSFFSRRWFLKELFYPFVFKIDKFNNDKPFCFVLSSILPISYLKYLKKKHKGCKLVKLHRDLVKITHKNSEYTEEIMNEIFDLRMTYDQDEAKKYGLKYFHEIESKIDIEISDKYPLCDVFFAGRAKDRLPKILKAYEIFTNAGLKCDFYVTNVPKNEQVKLEGITYAEKYMPYIEMLYKSVNAKCMLDINQAGAVGYTSRFLEAIMYNKKIIIDNPSVKESKYYNPKYIQYVETMDKINPQFVKDDYPVDYCYKGDFSPVHLIKQIDDELMKLQNIK